MEKLNYIQDNIEDINKILKDMAQNIIENGTDWYYPSDENDYLDKMKIQREMFYQTYLIVFDYDGIDSFHKIDKSEKMENLIYEVLKLTLKAFLCLSEYCFGFYKHNKDDNTVYANVEKDEEILYRQFPKISRINPNELGIGFNEKVTKEKYNELLIKYENKEIIDSYNFFCDTAQHKKNEAILSEEEKEVHAKIIEILKVLVEIGDFSCFDYENKKKIIDIIIGIYCDNKKAN